MTIEATISPQEEIVYEQATFHIVGTAQLVSHRFSHIQRYVTYLAPPPFDVEQEFLTSRYISDEGWDGFMAVNIRLGLIRVCKLAGVDIPKGAFSIVVETDGRLAGSSETSLVRIVGTPSKLIEHGRVARRHFTMVRAVYSPWSAFVKLRWDPQQFTHEEVTHMLVRVGLQIGIGEGAPGYVGRMDGSGWGTFDVVNQP